MKQILVATHGTEGALRAETHALRLARLTGARLHALYVIHKGWGSLVGIDWLNASHVRMQFYRHAEGEIHKRAAEVLERFAARAAAEQIPAETSVVVGLPVEVVPREAVRLGADLIVLGAPASRRSEEYRARIPLKKLLKAAPCPLCIVPGYPPPATLPPRRGEE